MGRQAGQKQAPAQDNRGQINRRYPGETAVTDTKCVVGLQDVAIVEKLYCRFAELLLQPGSIREINC